MKKLIKPERLRPGDTIGIIAPAYALKPEHVPGPEKTLRELGFKVKLSKNLFSQTDGYAGSAEERAEDFNEMIADGEVKMLLFGGGEVCNEILPYIDYENIARHPKILCSYSDSTTILNAVHSKTGLVTFYGASLRTFDNLTDYNRQSFINRFVAPETKYVKSGDWQTIRSGAGTGVLSGGYLENYAALQGLRYFALDAKEKYLLFIEFHECFGSPAVASKWFSNLAHRGVFERASGLIFGHYSANPQPQIDAILERIGESYKIPVVKCEDFGHGQNNAVFPIGITARMDTKTGVFEFLENGVL